MENLKNLLFVQQESTASVASFKPDPNVSFYQIPGHSGNDAQEEIIIERVKNYSNANAKNNDISSTLVSPKKESNDEVTLKSATVYCESGGPQVRLVYDPVDLIVTLSFFTLSNEPLSTSECRLKLDFSLLDLEINSGIGWLTLSQDLFYIMLQSGVMYLLTPNGTLALKKKIISGMHMVEKCSRNVNANSIFAITEQGDIIEVVPTILVSGRLVADCLKHARFSAPIDPTSDQKFFFSRTRESGLKLLAFAACDSFVLLSLSSGAVYIHLLGAETVSSKRGGVFTICQIRKQKDAVHNLNISLDKTKISMLSLKGRFEIFLLNYVAFETDNDPNSVLQKLVTFNMHLRETSILENCTLSWCGDYFACCFVSPLSLLFLIAIDITSINMTRWISIKFGYPTQPISHTDSIVLCSLFGVELLRLSTRQRFVLYTGPELPISEHYSYESFRLLHISQKLLWTSLTSSELSFLLDKDMKPALKLAKEQCIDLACFEFNIRNQITLLHAVTTANAFLQNFGSDQKLEVQASDSYSSDFTADDSFVRLCQDIRIANALRHQEIGMPLTLRQFQEGNFETFIMRLASRNMHFFACTLLSSVSSSNDPSAESISLKLKLMRNWAIKRIFKRESPMPTAYKKYDEIVRILGHSKVALNEFSFGATALAADSVNENLLALLLLEQETYLPVKICCLLQTARLEDSLSLICGEHVRFKAGSHELLQVQISHMTAKTGKEARDLDKELRILNDMEISPEFGLFLKHNVERFLLHYSKAALKQKLFLDANYKETVLLALQELRAFNFSSKSKHRGNKKNDQVLAVEEIVDRRLKQLKLIQGIILHKAGGNTSSTADISNASPIKTSEVSTSIAGSVTRSRNPFSVLRPFDSGTVTSVDGSSSTRFSVSGTQNSLEEKIALQHLDLLLFQQRLYKSTGEDLFFGVSLLQTLRSCFSLGLNFEATELRQKFNISPKVFYITKLESLAESKDWNAFRQLVQARTPRLSSAANNSGFGFSMGMNNLTTLSFVFDITFVVDTCLKFGNKPLAIDFTSQVSDVHERLTLFLDLKLYEQAAFLSIQIKDRSAMQYILSQCKDDKIKKLVLDSLAQTQLN